MQIHVLTSFGGTLPMSLWAARTALTVSASVGVYTSSPIKGEFGMWIPFRKLRLRVLHKRGLARASRGDLEGAISEFSRAIALIRRLQQLSRPGGSPV